MDAITPKNQGMEPPAAKREARASGATGVQGAKPPGLQHVFNRCRNRFKALNAIIYYDLSPLREAHWTGIPVVAAGFARALLDTLPDHVRFFADYHVIEADAVNDALRRNTGLFLDRDILQGYAVSGKLPVFGEAAGMTVGFFPSVKPLRRAFDVELSFSHDLSTLTMPWMHIRGNVVHHMEAIVADLASDDLVVTVSEASRSDLISYFGIDPELIVAAPNGVSWPDWYESEAINAAGPAGAEPYFLILGTREPRKNIMKVFDLLEQAPGLLDRHRFVFAGKMGWLEEQHALPRSLEPYVESGRILFPGFVSELEKYVLLRHARATLYPSLYEGFGLPVLESLSVGTPCVASWSSSIPAVGGECCEYFDPFSAGDFDRAIAALMARTGPRLRDACRARTAQFTWQAALGRVLERVLELPALVGTAQQRARRRAAVHK